MPTQTAKRLFPLGLAAGALAACLLAAPVSAQAPAPTEVLQSPPPPVMEFKEQPEVILIPQSRVYYVPDLKYDLFRYGRYWYINNEGNWYRARSYRGPFNSVSFRRIPRSITQVPSRYHKHPLTRPTADPGITRGVGDALRRTVGTQKQPTPGLGNRKSAITRPTGQQPAPTRKTWNRAGKTPARSPAAKKQAPSAGAKRPASSKVKKPDRPEAPKKAPPRVKKPTRSSTGKAKTERTKPNIKKSPKRQAPKKAAPKKPAPKKQAPKKPAAKKTNK